MIFVSPGKDNLLFNCTMVLSIPEESLNMKINKDNAQFRAVFDTAIDGIIIINGRGIIVDVNQAALDLFCYEYEELVDNTVNILMPEPHKSSHDGYVDHYKETGEKKIIGIGREVEGVKKNGDRFPFRLAVSELKQEDGRYFTGIIHDLTREREAEEKLKNYAKDLENKVNERTLQLEDSQRLYRSVAKNFPLGTISVLDRDFKFKFTEGKEWKRRKLSPDSLIGTYFPDLYEAEEKSDIENNLNDVLAGNDQVITVTKGNEIYELNVVPLRGANNEIMELLLVETNITEQRTAEREIYKALQKEKDLHEMKSRFVSMASHEFRTPLANVLTSATLLGKYPTNNPDRSDKHLHRIKSNVRNLNQILDDFLSLDKLSEGHLKYRPASLNLNELLSEVMEEMEPMLKSGQKVNISMNKDPLEVYLDPLLIKNVFINILSNAIKYSEKDVEVNVKGGETLRIEIADKGIGIPKAELSHMFQRFFRAENALNIEGTGLGLHIVRKYLDIMNGDIAIESELNQGTTIKLTIKDYLP
jgi:PAS domain S-box-containing protein